MIGNPPFGKRSSLCLKFMNHAAKFADTISFILPATFNKTSLINKVPLNFELKLSKYLGPRSCVNTNINCVFQIWRKISTVRDVKKLARKHSDFEFLKPGDISACFCLKSSGLISDLGKVYSIAVASKKPTNYH